MNHIDLLEWIMYIDPYSEMHKIDILKWIVST